MVQGGEHVSSRAGDVVGRARLDLGHPDREAVRVAEHLQVPAVSLGPPPVFPAGEACRSTRRPSR